MTQRIYFGISDVDSAEDRAQRKILAGQATILTLGDLTKRPSRKSHVSQYNDKRQGHPVPYGCMWAKNCGECPWPDCIVPDNVTPLAYGSKKATRLRSGLVMIMMRREGASEDVVAGVFEVHPRSVRRYIGEILGAVHLGNHRDIPDTPAQKIAEMIVVKLRDRKL